MNTRKLRKAQLFLIAAIPFVLLSQDVGPPVPPGKLSKAHAQWPGLKNCSQCHSAEKKADPLKCLDCHKDLAARIAAGTGYHRDKKEDCAVCHPEHNGEDFQLIQWDIKDFDHSETGYLLNGLHQKVSDCDYCHTPGNSLPGKKLKSYLLKDTRCTACHRDFDHSRAAFSLTGKHRDLECRLCHNSKTPHTRETRKSPGGMFECRHCHASPHPGNQTHCAECHTTATWRVDPW